MQFFVEAGWPIFPVYVLGLFTFGLAVRHALRPAPERVALIVGFGVATILMGVLGTVLGVQYSVAHIHQVAASERWIFLVGLKEALNNLVASLSLVMIAAIVATIGSYRLAGMPRLAARAGS